MDRRVSDTSPDILVVSEIFHSIQGESTHAGRPCVFVRLAYCNLRCSYCDTEYAFEDGQEMAIDDILQRIESHSCRLVEVTGGEPLFQPNVHELLRRLCDRGYEVLLETSGSLDISLVDPRVKRIVDLKCPSSGMSKKNLWTNLEYIKPCDEIKLVIGDREDYEWAKDILSRHVLCGGCSILFSPVFGVLEPVTLAQWILEDKLDVRLELQLHKFIWNPKARGV